MIFGICIEENDNKLVAYNLSLKSDKFISFHNFTIFNRGAITKITIYKMQYC